MNNYYISSVQLRNKINYSNIPLLGNKKKAYSKHPARKTNEK